MHYFYCIFEGIKEWPLRRFTAMLEQHCLTEKPTLPSITKMAPALLRKFLEKSSQRTDYEKLPSLSGSTKSLQTIVTKNAVTGTSKESSDAENKDDNEDDIKTICIQLCPHETLSFERMKRIVHLPFFKCSGDKIGAFTKAPSPHHVPSKAGTYRCKPYPKSFSSLKANGYYRYQQGYEGGYEGLILCIDWSMNFDDHMDLVGSVSEIQRLLDALEIHLCQHTTLSDLRIATKLYRFCHSNRLAGDPVEAYEEAHRARRVDGCKKCHTTFEMFQDENACHIQVKRYLGKGISAYERRWLAQCGERRRRLRSLGVAALQSCRYAFGT